VPELQQLLATPRFGLDAPRLLEPDAHRSAVIT
jgi:hypothetical protein